MPAIVRQEIIEPSGLSAEAAEAWIDRLYPVHCEIFHGVSRADFASYVVRSKAERTRIQVSYGPGDEIAGYVASHAFHRSFRGERCTVIRAEAGLRRAWRGDGSAAPFLLGDLLRGFGDNPGRHYYLGCLVHPSSYTAIFRTVGELWPAPGVEIPADVMAFLMELAEEFHLELLDEARPLVRKVGWITADTEVERQYWETCDSEPARFYIEQNPTYPQGSGLMTLVPLDAANVGRALANWGSGRVQRGLRRTLGALERTVLNSQLDGSQAEGLLRRIEERAGFTLDAVREHGLVGTRYPVPARRVLMRAGERGEDLYAIVSGSMLVLGQGPDGAEFVIDQLGPGQLVGELAVLTGQPRLATVRAARDSVLLRLTAEDLNQLVTAAPELDRAVWAYVAARTLTALGSKRPDIPRRSADLDAWMLSGDHESLPRGSTRPVEAARRLILTRGRIALDGPQGWSVLSAPTLLALPAGVTLTGLEDARISLLSEPPPT